MGFKNRYLVFAALVVFRTIDALSVKTFFQPDEYFQSLEPAWQTAFGVESKAWITWEWKERLRPSFHPLLFAAVYKTADSICTTLRLNRSLQADVLLAAPKVLQAVFAATTDLFTWHLAAKIYGWNDPSTDAALALTILSPWQWFCSVRTFSNSVETTLTAVALDLFLGAWFKLRQKSTRTNSSLLYPPLIAAAVACILRPTNIIVWSAVSLSLLWQDFSSHKFWTLTESVTVCGVCVLTLSAVFDGLYYGEATFPPLRFVYFNLVQSLAVFYGRNRVDYYFTEGLPLLMTTMLPFGFLGLWQSLSRRKADNPSQAGFALAMATIISILALTCISHKEVRFIFPLLPILHVLAARPFASFFDGFPIPRSRLKISILVLGLIANLFIAGYVSLVHQRGVVDVMHYLRHEQEVALMDASQQIRQPPLVNNITVGFLMPCHSTPWRAYFVHREIDAWALTCEPPLHQTLEEREVYLDEADIFYANPLKWIDDHMEDREGISAKDIKTRSNSSVQASLGKRQWPDYLVFFEHLEPIMETALEGTSYKQCRRFFNTHWIDDRRRKGDVIVWCKGPRDV